MLFRLFSDPKNFILGLLLSIPGLVIALSMHEFAHGFAAYKMGDNTAKHYGRLTLNPFHHLELMGTPCLFLCGFGWAKPVPINPYNFRHRRLGVIVVSLAGPLMNFLIALISAFVTVIIRTYMPYSELTQFLYSVMVYCMYLNIGLMCFNLIPIPPLDGSKVLLELLPFGLRRSYYQLERYSSLILMVILLTGILDPVLVTMRSAIENVIMFIVGLIF